jgi:hypothetical protein
MAENTPTSPVVHTASATDNVGVTAYAFETGGADNNRFSLNTATGALTFINSPNFEAPGSAAGTNTYTVRVRASDAAGNSAVQTVTVNVTDLDEVLPVFTAGPSATASIAENTPTSTVVHTASATDNVGVTAYAFDGSGADNNRFSINAATGALRFLSSPNFEAPGSAAGTNTYTVRVRANDAAGNSAVQTVTVNVTDVDDTAPVFAAGASTNVSMAENTPTSTVVHTATATDNVGVTAYAFEAGGADNARFSLNTSTGALRFLSSPDFETPGSAAGSNTYTVRVRASDAAGNNAIQTVTVNVTDVFDSVPTNSAQAFTLWQEAELAWLGDSSKNINALNQHSAAIMQIRDTTSADGSANQADPAKRLSQYINQVTGTDIVSDAEFDAGFSITGKAAAGAQATIKFRLDKDRTTGVDGQGAQVLNLGGQRCGQPGRRQQPRHRHRRDRHLQQRHRRLEPGFCAGQQGFAASHAQYLWQRRAPAGGGHGRQRQPHRQRGQCRSQPAVLGGQRHGQQQPHRAGEPELYRARQAEQRCVRVLLWRPGWGGCRAVDNDGQR